MKPRKNELSPVYHRNLYELLPPNTNIERWKSYIEDYNNASKLIKNDHPVELDLELNSTCNLKCEHCLHSIRDRGNYNLGWNLYTKLINEAVEYGVTSLKLNYWNEPLLVKNLEIYIKYAKNKGIVNIFFSTNAILLNTKRAISLIDSGLTKILISIDAASNETYKKERKSNDYNLVVDNVKNFINLRNEMKKQFPLVRVNFLKTMDNIHEEKMFYNIWKDVADMMIFQEMNELPDIDSGIFIKPDKQSYKCSFPFKLIAVDSRGNMYPCPCMSGQDFFLGNIKTMTLKEAWNGNVSINLRKNQIKYGHTYYKSCRRCIDGE